MYTTKNKNPTQRCEETLKGSLLENPHENTIRVDRFETRLVYDITVKRVQCRFGGYMQFCDMNQGINWFADCQIQMGPFMEYIGDTSLTLTCREELVQSSGLPCSKL